MSDAVIRLDLVIRDARLLREQLAYRLAELDRDLVRTDKHALQHALAEDVKRLEVVKQRLDLLLRDAGDS
jgi:hypothetical protein